MDALSHCPDCDGEDADAVGAYTQVFMKDYAYLLSSSGRATSADTIETWISLPYEQRPKGFEHIKDPVFPLLRNLYGHPLAGLFWEKFCKEKLFACGFENRMGVPLHA